MAGTLTIVGVITVMLLTNLPFTLISIVIVPLLALIVFIYPRSIKAATKKEKKLEGQVSNVAAGRTVLMITHRLSTVGKVDEILVMKDGRIAEQGTYKALKQREGIFANLLKVQNADTLDPDLSLSIRRTASEPPDPRYSQVHVLIEVDGTVIARRQLDKLVLTVGRIPAAHSRPAQQGRKSPHERR